MKAVARALLPGFALAAAACSARAEDAALLPPALGLSEQVLGDGRTGLGLFGFDPTSYWFDGTPKPGRPDTEASALGFAWRFAGAANRAAFLRDPAAFLPRMGGMDATGIAAGRLAAGDPTLFALRDGRLYLFRTDASRARFLADPGLAAAAESRWPALRAGLVSR